MWTGDSAQLVYMGKVDRWSRWVISNMIYLDVALLLMLSWRRSDGVVDVVSDGASVVVDVEEKELME